MNTAAKGSAFERKALRIIRRELKERRLLFIPEHCKTFHRKGYYHKELEKDVIVDISIESFLPGQKDRSYLTLIECKDYSGTVPVNDIKEFRDNIREIGAHKGIMIASGPFAEGVEKIAKSAGIGLLRILPAAKLQWVLHRTTSGAVPAARKQGVRVLLRSDFYSSTPTSNLGRFVGFVDGHMVHTLAQLFEWLFWEDRHAKPEAQQIFLPPVASKSSVGMVSLSDIGSRTQSILCRHAPANWETPLQDIVAELERAGELKLEYRDSLGVDGQGQPILGSISFNPTRILISRQTNENLHRQRFTVAHELGHHCLGHGQYMEKEYYSSNDFNNTGHGMANFEDVIRMEWQANMFASYLLLPANRLFEALQPIFRRFDIKDKGYGTLYLDTQECNYRQFMQVTNHIMQKFNVSRQVVEIALRRLGILNDVRSSPSRVGDAAQNLLGRVLKPLPY